MIIAGRSGVVGVVGLMGTAEDAAAAAPTDSWEFSDTVGS